MHNGDRIVLQTVRDSEMGAHRNEAGRHPDVHIVPQTCPMQLGRPKAESIFRRIRSNDAVEFFDL